MPSPGPAEPNAFLSKRQRDAAALPPPPLPLAARLRFLAARWILGGHVVEAKSFGGSASGLAPIIPGGEELPRGYEGRPLRFLGWDAERAVVEGYKSNVHIRAGIRAKARALASVPIAVYEQTADGWRPATTPKALAAAALINRPTAKMPRPFLTKNRLIFRSVAKFELTGNALIRKLRGVSRTGPPAALKDLSVVGWSPVPDPVNFIGSFRFELGGRVEDVDAADIIHVQIDDLLNPHWGSPDLESVRREVDTYGSALDWNRSSLENRTLTGAVFAAKGPPLSDTQYEDFQRQIDQTLRGAQQVDRAVVVGNDVDVKQMGRNAVEMDWNQSLVTLRNNILSAVNVPPVEAGFFDEATLANAAESRRLFWLDAVVPLGGVFAESFSMSLMPDFGLDPERFEFQFDYSKVEALQKSTDEKVATFQRLLSVGVPYNEANKFCDMGLPPLPPGVGDVPFGLQQFKPAPSFALGAPAPQPAAGPGPGAAPTDAAAAAKARRRALRRAVMEGTKDAAGGASAAGEGTAAGQPPAVATVGAIGLAAPTVRTVEIEARKLAVDLAGRMRTALAGFASSLDGAALAVAKRAEVNAILSAFEARLASELRPIYLESMLRGAQGARDAVVSAGGEMVVDHAALGGRAAASAEEIARLLRDSSRKGVYALRAARDAGLAPLSDAQFAELLRVTAPLHGVQARNLAARLGKALAQEEAQVERELASALDEAGGLIAARAELIAENESARAVSRGALEGWTQARDQGAVGRTTKTWITADTPCEICEPLDGQTVEIDEDFVHPDTGETYDCPPAPHTLCECGLVLTVHEPDPSADGGGAAEEEEN